ncbi:caspase-3-like [Diadema antillarum]|uniref:caspase-3-like n=1 Tax=Diadema antillarum TaxID=105358 RepID=UPI003A89E69B
MSEEAVKEIQREMLRKLRNDITDEQFGLMKREIQQKELGGFGAGDIQRTIKTIDTLFDKLAQKQIFKTTQWRKMTALIQPSKCPNKVIIPQLRIQGLHSTRRNYVHASRCSTPLRSPAAIHGCLSVRQSAICRTKRPCPAARSDSLPRGTSFSDGASGNKGFDHRVFYEPGKCLVLFINNLFTGRSNQRLGAETDEGNVRGLFKDLGDNYSELTYKKDVTKGELENYLRTSQSTLRKGEYKSFIFIIGTHGQPQRTKKDGPEKDGVLMADEKWMLVDDIIKYFHGDKIPEMKDMPKIFIIQSCRGTEHVGAVSYSDSPSWSSSQEVLDSLEIPGFLTRPVNSDVLIAYATTEGTKAWRDSSEGSWFVKDLCDVIAEFKDKEHILDILVRVNNRMVWRESTEGRAKQMPCFVCTFTKRFMFVLK